MRYLAFTYSDVKHLCAKYILGDFNLLPFQAIEAMTDVYPRHEDHEHTHYAHVKYGYIVFLLSCSVVCLLSVKNSVVDRIPRKYARFLKPPLWVTVVLWFIFLCSFCIFHNMNSGLNGFAKRAGR